MDIFLGCSNKISEDLKSRFMNYISLGEFRSLNPSDYLCVLKQTRGENLVISNERFEIVFDGYIPGTQDQILEKKISELADKIVSGTKIDFNNYSGLFNICIRDKNSGDIILASDPSALLPLNYISIEGVFYYCSHLHIMGSLLNSVPDFAGIAQKVTLGYILGARTLYSGISRLNPGEKIIFRSASGKIESSYGVVYYTEYKNEKDIERLLYESLLGSCGRMHNSYSSLGLMLSEGADSRFLGGLARQIGFSIKSYTHITPGAGGQKILESIAGMLNSEHHFQSVIDGYSTSNEQLEKQLLLADNLSYPFWLPGSDYFKKTDADYPVIIGSSLDCILDGNIFHKPAKQKRQAVMQRYSEIIKQDSGLLTERYVERLSAELIKSLYLNFSKGSDKFLANQFQHDISTKLIEELKGLNDYISSEMNRISATGSSLPSLQLQRFILENRDRKLFFGQPLTIRKLNRIYIPSFEYDFLSKASAIHPVHKLHHKLYLRILKKFLPDQLKIKSGTYGLAPHYPRIILETARFIHKSREKKIYRELLEKKGNMDISGFRSATIFELCGRSDATHKGFGQLIINNPDVFNTSAMKSYIDQARDYKIRVFNYERIYRGLEICQVVKGHC